MIIMIKMHTVIVTYKEQYKKPHAVIGLFPDYDSASDAFEAWFRTREILDKDVESYAYSTVEMIAEYD